MNTSAVHILQLEIFKQIDRPDPPNGLRETDGFRRTFRRLFAFGWILLALAGALNHTLVPGLYDADGWLPRALPHLRWGYVMFRDVSPEVPVVRWTSDAPPLDTTPALGYANARAFVDSMLAAARLEHLCRTHPEFEEKSLTRDIVRVGTPPTVVRTRTVVCRQGRLVAR